LKSYLNEVENKKDAEGNKLVTIPEDFEEVVEIATDYQVFFISRMLYL
jgi:hypothetical protein